MRHPVDRATARGGPERACVPGTGLFRRSDPEAGGTVGNPASVGRMDEGCLRYIARKSNEWKFLISAEEAQASTHLLTSGMRIVDNLVESEFMTVTEAKKEIRALKEHRKEVTSSKKAAVEFLVDAGILEKNGKQLAKPYR